MTKATKAFLWNNRLTAKLLGRRRSRSEKETTLSPVHLLFSLLRLAADFDNGKTMDNPAFPSSTTIQIEGTVLQKSITSKQQILTIGNLEKQSRQKRSNILRKKKLVIYDDSFRKVKFGDRICVKGDGETFEEARNPGNFDQREYYRKKHTTGFCGRKRSWSRSGQKFL